MVTVSSIKRTIIASLFCKIIKMRLDLGPGEESSIMKHGAGTH